MENRRELCVKMRDAEQTEIACSERRAADETYCAAKVAEEREQMRRSAEANAIAARAAEVSHSHPVTWAIFCMRFRIQCCFPVLRF